MFQDHPDAYNDSHEDATHLWYPSIFDGVTNKETLIYHTGDE
jgi:hypothetical protein